MLLAPHLLDEQRHKIAGARCLGIRYHKVEILRGVEVVVDKHTLGVLVLIDEVAKLVKACKGVEIKAEDDVCTLDSGCCTTLLVVLEDDDILDTWHKLQVVGITVGEYAVDLVT